MKKPSLPSKGLYSMRVVSKLTGLPADTIRKWEQRHGAVRPQRTAGNTRKFSAVEVRRLALMRELTGQGHHIRDLAELDEGSLESLRQVSAPSLPATGGSGAQADGGSSLWAGIQQDYLSAVERFEVRAAASILNRAAALLSPNDFALGLVLPILHRVGQRWQEGTLSVAHEHLVSAQVRSLVTLMLQWNAPLPGARKVLITTLEGHLHEFGVLIGAMLAASRGFEPIYLGVSVPEDDIARAARQSRAEVLLLSLVTELESAELRRTAASLKRLSADIEIWLGLPREHRLAKHKTGVRLMSSFEELDMALTQLGSAAR